ncbi:hypothetical protein IQ13_1581 [Lacibacter cauensis]|uniref:Uncharacterized protein n=1 Tax=Lacibacter cauensis TaxID=510947 RepID=A0A562SQD4_9BACT|nr:hypothetical protein [Lacibacter cauensis]TWI83469.1 hypothetical protein IQ13_1581 [Lacibacter cauensis]
MNINRHNYEEFFLLYVDNELTAGQREIVEAFVAANPDLQEEFALINQSTFTADAKLDDAFMQSLLKPVEESSVNEEQLLLYVDEELPAAEKANVEKELLTNTSLQKELLWLRRSQVKPDTSIVFPDKQLLYKQAEPARVFSLSASARRWSAAAAVVVLLGSAMWLMMDKEYTPDATKVAVAERTNGQQKATQSPKTVIEILEEEKKKQDAENGSVAVNETINAQNNTQTNTVTVSTTVVNNNTGNTTTTTKPNVEVEPVTTTQPDVAKNNFDVPSNNSATPTVQPIETSTATNAAYTLYNNDVAAVDNEEDNELLTEERQRRSGIAGLLKKAKRTFERKTGIQSGSSEVRFAVFAVNTQ